MKTLPLQARLFVCAVIVLGAGLLVAFFPPLISIASPWLFLLLLTLSSVTSVFKVTLPLAASPASYATAAALS